MPQRSEISLAGTPKNASPLKACQGKCDGAERVPEGGVQLNPNKWVCAGCWGVMKRRLAR